MPIQITTDGLIVQAKNTNEFDRVLTLLTADMGIVTAYAKNIRKRRGADSAATELLSYSHFILAQKDSRFFVDKAEPNHIFFGLRQSVESLSLASYFCQLAGELVFDEKPGDMPLRLLLNAFYLLDRGDAAPALIKSAVELRLLAMCGYMPDMVACAGCGGDFEDGGWFFPTDGVVYCSPECAVSQKGIRLSPGVLSAMQHILYSDFDRIFSFKLSQPSLDELGGVCESYLLSQVERLLPALEFYHSIT